MVWTSMRRAWVIAVVACIPLTGVMAADAAPKTVEATYRGLSSGPLRMAQLADLPEGTLLRAAGTTITTPAVAKAIAEAKPAVRPHLATNQFFVLEQMATEALLLAEARAWAAESKRDTSKEADPALIRAYLTSLGEKATVSDAEVRAFFDANPEMFAGAKYESVQKDIATYLLDEKRQQLADQHVATLSEHVVVEVNATWLQAQAATALDNPVDKARRSGKPAVVDFGADGCRPCDLMAPILEELRGRFAGKCDVLFVHVREQQVLAARYGISSIPVQVFFDRDGKEVFRHTGFFPKVQMLAKLAELGVE